MSARTVPIAASPRPDPAGDPRAFLARRAADLAAFTRDHASGLALRTAAGDPDMPLLRYELRRLALLLDELVDRIGDACPAAPASRERPASFRTRLRRWRAGNELRLLRVLR